MKTSKKFSSGQDLNDCIVNEALTNDKFKNQLIDNPRKTINEFASGEYYLSEDLNVIVHDESDTNFIYFNIPAKIDMDDIELSNEELEIVAGGGTSWTWSLLSGLICLGYQTTKHLDNCGCPE
jgi:hypothetical protein